MAFSLVLRYSLLCCLSPSQLSEGEKCVCPFVFLRPYASVYDSIKLGMVECALMKTACTRLYIHMCKWQGKEKRLYCVRLDLCMFAYIS